MGGRTKRRFSTRLIRKGALIEETYLAFQHWEIGKGLRENLRRIEQSNTVGATNAAWLREIVVTLSSRFGAVDVEPLVILAQGGYPIEDWRSCLLWHAANVDALYYRFATEWLLPEHQKGTHVMITDDVVPFVRNVFRKEGPEGGLSDYGVTRAARDLLKMAADFGLVVGKPVRRFGNFHLSENCVLYVAHALAEKESNALKIIQSPDWRLFLLTSGQVERELLNLHQFRKVQYDAAGSLVQLTLPCQSLTEYARTLVS